MVIVGNSNYTLMDTALKASQYSLFVEEGILSCYADSTLAISVQIDDNHTIDRHLFLNTVSVLSVPSDIKLSNVQSEFIWVASQSDVQSGKLQNINQPFNFPSQPTSTVFLDLVADSNTTALIGISEAAVDENSLYNWDVILV